MSDEAHVMIYEYDDLRTKLIIEGAEDCKLLDQILEECGNVLGRHYVVMSHSSAEDENPWMVVQELLDSAFPKLAEDRGPDREHFGTSGIFSEPIISGIDLTCKYTIAERLGIDLPVEKDDTQEDMFDLRVEELESLEPGWDMGDAEPIGSDVIASLKELGAAIKEHNACFPLLYEQADGDVSANWANGTAMHFDSDGVVFIDSYESTEKQLSAADLMGEVGRLKEGGLL